MIITCIWPLCLHFSERGIVHVSLMVWAIAEAQNMKTKRKFSGFYVSLNLSGRREVDTLLGGIELIPLGFLHDLVCICVYDSW